MALLLCPSCARRFTSGQTGLKQNILCMDKTCLRDPKIFTDVEWTIETGAPEEFRAQLQWYQDEADKLNSGLLQDVEPAKGGSTGSIRRQEAIHQDFLKDVQDAYQKGFREGHQDACTQAQDAYERGFQAGLSYREDANQARSAPPPTPPRRSEERMDQSQGKHRFQPYR